MNLLDKSFARAVDGTATALARSLMFSRSLPSSNTLAELQAFRQYSIDELFGAAPPMPYVTVTPRRGTPKFSWRNLAFASSHRPITPGGQRLQNGDYIRNGEAHACWLRHRKPRKDGTTRPTVLFLHSWMAPVSRAEDRLVLPYIARRLDADIVSLHLPYHGRRKPDGSAFHGEYFWTADLARTFEALRQSIADARALMMWLRSQQTDAAPVGVMGVSLGGMVALGLACFEPTLDFAVPVAAHLDLAGILADAALLVPVRKELARHGWQPDDVRAYTHSLGLNDIRPTVAPERILMVIGRYDRIMTPDRVLELWRRWDEPQIHWFEAGHLGILTHLGGILAAAKPFIATTRSR